MRFLADAIHPEDLRQVARDALRNDGEPAVLLRDAARHHRSRRHRGRLHRPRTREQVRKRVFILAPFLHFKNDHFTKAGSGQTWGKHSKTEWRFASSMRLARTVNYAVRSLTQLESEMTSVERVLHFADLPIEQYLLRGIHMQCL